MKNKLDFNEAKKILSPHVRSFNNGLLRNYGVEPETYVYLPGQIKLKSIYSAKKIYALRDRLKKKEFAWQKETAK